MPVACSSPLLDLLRAMMRIRCFEQRLLALPRPGFQLLSSGEEAVAVGVCAALGPDDQLLCSGRSIGPALARGLEAGPLLAELQGKASGPCKGKGGRGHVAQPGIGFFGAHAVVGGNLTIAAGVALALQLRGVPAVAACIFGDGACGAGALHETLNLAAVWKLPLLLVCNNNQYSVSTPCREVLAPPRLADLARPFGIPARTVDGMDVCAVRDAVQLLLTQTRAGGGPAFLECVTYRFEPHSTATREHRPAAEIAAWKARCPIRALSDRLLRADLADAATLAELQRQVEHEMADAVAFANAAPALDVSEALHEVE